MNKLAFKTEDLFIYTCLLVDTCTLMTDYIYRNLTVFNTNDLLIFDKKIGTSCNSRMMFESYINIMNLSSSFISTKYRQFYTEL